VITSVQRRRRWSRAEKEQIVAAAMEPGASPPRLPVQLGFTPDSAGAGQLCERTQIPAASNPVAIAPEAGMVSPPSPESAGVIEIEFATGGRMRITGAVDVPVRGAMWPLSLAVTC
jgi:transposase